MKKGISLVALVITIIVLIILTAAVIWSGADTPEQTKLSVFYNDISTIQDAVTLKILTNVADMETKDWDPASTHTTYSKYVGILDDTLYNGDIITTGEGENATPAGEILKTATASATLKVIVGKDSTGTDVTKDVKVYALSEDAAENLGLSISQNDIQKFGIDAAGKVYYYEGLKLFPNDAEKSEDIYVTKDLVAESGYTNAKVITAY